MMKQELLAFEHSTPDLSEITWYQCGGDRISLVYYGVWFKNEVSQKHFFKNHQEAIEAEFGQPSFDAFDLGWVTKLVFWLEGKEEIEKKLPLVQWLPESGGIIMLQYSRQDVDGKAYGVTMSWEQ